MKDAFKKLNEMAAELKPDAIDFAQRLIRIPSLPGEEKAVSELYVAEMKKIGYDEVHRDEWGNIIGIIKGDEPGPTIMYNGHLDHVPEGDRSLWQGYNPYGGTIDVVEVDNQDMNGTELAEVIHGRGAGDTKGGDACIVYTGKALLKLRAMGYKLKGNYMVTIVSMEEAGDQVGMVQLTDITLPKMGWDYDGLISVEPTHLTIALGHRGRVELVVSVYGKVSHGSAPWLGINAVDKSTRLIDKVANELPRNFPADPDLGKSSIALTVINCSPGALCIVPEQCDITFDRRFVPGETPESCLQEIQDIIDEIAREDPEFKAEVRIAESERTFYTGNSTVIANKKNAWKMSAEHPFVQAMAQALEEVGQPVKYEYWYFGTDLSKSCATDRKPSLGYSPMQEQYIHTPFDKVRTDYMEKSIAGYAASFLKLMELPKEAFKLE